MPWKIPFMSTTYTPPFFICSASTTKSSPTATVDGISASPTSTAKWYARSSPDDAAGNVLSAILPTPAFIKLRTMVSWSRCAVQGLMFQQVQVLSRQRSFQPGSYPSGHGGNEGAEAWGKETALGRLQV